MAGLIARHCFSIPNTIRLTDLGLPYAISTYGDTLYAIPKHPPRSPYLTSNKRTSNPMSTNELKPIVIATTGLALNNSEAFNLGREIIRFKQENGRYPREVIFDEEMAQKYFDHYVQGKAYPVSFDRKPIDFIVNIRLRASSLIMRK